MLKILGRGNTAKIYEWENNKILKVFDETYNYETVMMEYNNALAISKMSFNKPKLYEYRRHQNNHAIVYEKISGASLLEWLSETGNIEMCSKYMVTLHKMILMNKIENIESYKTFLSKCIRSNKKSIE